MRYTVADRVPFVIVIVGLAILVTAEWFPSLVWQGIDWSNFLSNLGLYVAVVLALQWHYDKWTKQETIVSAVESALSNSNVVRAGIENYNQEPLMHMAPVARVCHQMLRLRLGRGNG